MPDRVLIVGSIALDDVVTPFGQVQGALGGSCVYGAFAASAFAPVDVVGVAGEDFPHAHLDRLRARGVDTSGLQVIPGGKTFRWGGQYEGDMEDVRTLYTSLNVFRDFAPQLPDAYRDDGVVFLAAIQPELQLSVLDQVRRPRLVLCDTIKLWLDTRRDAFLEVLKRSHVALLNANEARILGQTSSLPKAGMKLLDLGLERVIVKKGEHGVMMFSRDGFFATPAMPLEEVLDPTGAGDTFAGGFAGYLARHDPIGEDALRQAVVAGSALASFAVEDFSTARLEAAGPGDLERRCRRLTGAMNVPDLQLPV